MSNSEAISYILHYASDERRLGKGRNKHIFTQRSATVWACNKLYSELRMNPDKSPLTVLENFAKRMERSACASKPNTTVRYIFSVASDVANDILDGLYIYDQTPLEVHTHGKS